MFSKYKSIILVIFMLTANVALANSMNHYLPLKTDPLLELELEKLASVAQLPLLAKPYHLATVQNYLSKIRADYPMLYRRISQYLTRYNDTYNITHFATEISYSDFESKNIANQRGRTTESNIQGEIAGYINLSENWNLSLGATIFDGSGGVIPNNSYLSYYNEYFQIDLGYKEIWLSPLQESSMLLSTNAKPIARFAISSPTPWTDYQLRYDISFGKLEEMQGIKFDDEISPGKPGFLTMHFSAQPVDWWTLGFNRTMVFGGGSRSVVLGDVWDAIIDPINSDNCGGESELQDCNEEFGNQQASISNKIDFNLGMPVSVYAELAGEDSGGFRWYALGNRAYNLGVFLPYLTKSSSALVEYQLVRTGWYIHHLYAEGYRNNLRSMGHWWGDEKNISDGIGARILTLRYNLEFSNDYHLDVKLSTLKNINFGSEGQYDESIYQRANELTLGINNINKQSVIRYELYLGNSTFGDDFARFSIKYSWQ